LQDSDGRVGYEKGACQDGVESSDTGPKNEELKYAATFLNKLLIIGLFEQCCIHDESWVFQYDPTLKDKASTGKQAHLPH
jgi:hypothetical protein